MSEVRVSKKVESRIPKPPKPPEKPLMPYMRYSRKVWEQVKNANPLLKLWEVGKIIGQMWRELSEQEKTEFQEEYDSEKIQYGELMRQYHSSPVYLQWRNMKDKLEKEGIDEVIDNERRIANKRNETDKPVVVNNDGSEIKDVYTLEDVEAEDEEFLSTRHSALLRYERNHQLMWNIFGDVSSKSNKFFKIPDSRQLVGPERVKELRKQVSQLEGHLNQLNAQIESDTMKHETKLSKFELESCDFKENLRATLAAFPLISKEDFDLMMSNSAAEIRAEEKLKKERDERVRLLALEEEKRRIDWEERRALEKKNLELDEKKAAEEFLIQQQQQQQQITQSNNCSEEDSSRSKIVNNQHLPPVENQIQMSQSNTSVSNNAHPTHSWPANMSAYKPQNYFPNPAFPGQQFQAAQLHTPQPQPIPQQMIPAQIAQPLQHPIQPVENSLDTGIKKRSFKKKKSNPAPPSVSTPPIQSNAVPQLPSCPVAAPPTPIFSPTQPVPISANCVPQQYPTPHPAYPAYAQWYPAPPSAGSHLVPSLRGAYYYQQQYAGYPAYQQHPYAPNQLMHSQFAPVSQAADLSSNSETSRASQESDETVPAPVNSTAAYQQALQQQYYGQQNFYAQQMGLAHPQFHQPGNPYLPPGPHHNQMFMPGGHAQPIPNPYANIMHPAALPQANPGYFTGQSHHSQMMMPPPPVLIQPPANGANFFPVPNITPQIPQNQQQFAVPNSNPIMHPGMMPPPAMIPNSEEVKDQSQPVAEST